MTRNELRHASFIVVLDDGESYNYVTEAQICYLTDEEADELEAGSSPDEIEIENQFRLAPLVFWALEKGYFDDEEDGEPAPQPKPDAGVE